MKITIPSAPYFKIPSSLEGTAKMIKRNTKPEFWHERVIHVNGKKYIAVDNKEQPEKHFEEV